MRWRTMRLQARDELLWGAAETLKDGQPASLIQVPPHHARGEVVRSHMDS